MSEQNILQQLDSWLNKNFEWICTIVYRIINLIISIIVNVIKFFIGLMLKEYKKG